MLQILFDNGLVKCNGILELVFLYKQYMAHIDLPIVIFTAELDRLAEYPFHGSIVSLIPVDLCLIHEQRKIPNIDNDDDVRV